MDLTNTTWKAEQLSELERLPTHCHTLKPTDPTAHSRPGNLAWQTVCVICGSPGPAVTPKDLTHQTKRCVNNCKDPRLFLQKKRVQVANEPVNPKAQGRAPKVFLSDKGVTMPVAWWAEYMADGDPAKQKSIDNTIRQRLIQRSKGVPLTDHAVLWGILAERRRVAAAPPDAVVDVKLERLQRFGDRFREMTAERLSSRFSTEMRACLSVAMPADMAEAVANFVESYAHECMRAAANAEWQHFQKELEVFMALDQRDDIVRTRIEHHFQSKLDGLEARGIPAPTPPDPEDDPPPAKKEFTGWGTMEYDEDGNPID